MCDGRADVSSVGACIGRGLRAGGGGWWHGVVWSRRLHRDEVAAREGPADCRSKSSGPTNRGSCGPTVDEWLVPRGHYRLGEAGLGGGFQTPGRDISFFVGVVPL